MKIQTSVVFQRHYFQLLFLFVAFTCYSCNSDYFLERSDKSLVVPSKLSDLQALLDAQVMNENLPVLSEIGTDNYYKTYNNWQLMSSSEKYAYNWQKDPFDGQSVYAWNYPYQSVLYANIVLKGLEDLDSQKNTPEWRRIKASALFYRSHAFYHLVSLFAKAYDKQLAGIDPGIPLRLNAEIKDKIQRATNEQTYAQIINDLRQALALLPNIESPDNPLRKYRPGKVSTYALLARVFLSMQQYDKALLYADSSLKVYNKLMDYNLIDPTLSNPIANLNDEVIFYGVMSLSSAFTPQRRSLIDSTLYNLYHPDDLRKVVFFTTEAVGHSFKGNYTGLRAFFGGIASDELYLIKAECLARKGETDKAMETLNQLLVKRWKSGTFIPLTALDSKQALKIILTERRKELLFRGLRWTDLKRLNKEPQFAVSIKRELNGQFFELLPNHVRYVYPIPADEIAANNLVQNPR